MDPSSVEMNRREAGAAYMGAMRSLGLEPNGLFWAYDEFAHQFVLILVTDFFDFKGPLEISKLLFEAYNRSGTPREIDPFIVRLHSPAHAIISRLMLGLGGAMIKGSPGKPLPEGIEVSGVKFDGIQVYADWVYKRPSVRKKSTPSPIDLSRKWDRFVRHIDRLAA